MGDATNPDHVIDVSYDPKNQTFQVSDAKGMHDHCKGNEWIRWDLKSGGSNMTIEFSDGTAFKTPQTTLSGGTPYQFSPPHQHNQTYCYIIHLTALSGHKVQSPDPKIMFDDGKRHEGPDRSTVPDPAAITDAAKLAWQAIFQDLQNAGAKGASGSGISFYPHGINDIEVTIAVGPVNVSVKVIGPSS